MSELAPPSTGMAMLATFILIPYCDPATLRGLLLAWPPRSQVPLWQTQAGVHFTQTADSQCAHARLAVCPTARSDC